jgi:hypothetical protein
MEDAGVVLTTTNTAIAELVQDWSTPQGSELIQLLNARRNELKRTPDLSVWFFRLATPTTDQARGTLAA